MLLTVCCYHVTYAFQSESTLYICLNVKELLARNMHNIWSLTDCNGTRTHNLLVRNNNLITLQFSRIVGTIFVAVNQTFKQLYKSIYITKIHYLFSAVRIVGWIVQMYTDLKVLVRNTSEMLQNKNYFYWRSYWSIVFFIKNIFIELPVLKLVSMTIM